MDDSDWAEQEAQTLTARLLVGIGHSATQEVVDLLSAALRAAEARGEARGLREAAEAIETERQIPSRGYAASWLLARADALTPTPPADAASR